jgi:nicotinate-nucleotide adenylyltransferase
VSRCCGVSMRLGIFGGSFDPVHLGHLVVAETCREQARLDRVLFVPVALQPHKQERPPAPAADRLEMLRLATGGHDAFAVTSIEIDRGGVSYTADTLDALAADHPRDELLLMLGPDALAGLPRWHEPGRILGAATILAVEREGLDDVGAIVGRPDLAALLGEELAGEVIATRVRVPAIGIRGTDLRAAVAGGGSIRYRTPRAVERYIATHGLYRREA